MYEIRPETLKTFVEDSNIKLPRFQRKQTWDNKKNFELCISIFKEYPIGVTILNIERNGNNTTRWLLDGRQRRNALAQFYNDPENVYNWAKKYIGFLNSDQPSELEEKFWKKISEYLEDDENNDESQNDEYNPSEDENDEDENIIEKVEEGTSEYNKSLNGLDLLLYIIKLTHNKSKTSNGFTRPFDFSEYTKNLPYLDTETGSKQLSSKKVKSFIKEYKNYCNDENFDFQELNSFEKFIFYRLNVIPEKKEKLKIFIQRNWDSIFERIDILDKIVTLYTNSKIGLIEVKDLKSTDSQKIFNIINSKGTTLTAVEILSAKPSWNKVINSPTQKQKDATKILYSKIDVKNDNVVKWDLAATIIDRLDYKEFFFKNFSDTKSDFEKKLTTGFKILSGIKENGVKKEDIDSLGTNQSINWEIDYEELINDLNNMFKVIISNSYFKFLKSYEFSLMGNLSDAIALNFIVILYNDWLRKGKPTGNELAKQFQKNAFILLDNLIFEYITRQWRGSSDGIIARNIVNSSSLPDLFIPLEKNKWSDILDEIFDKNSILDEKVSKNILEPVLLHYYSLNSIQAPDSNYTLEVDHIIPQSLFKSSSINDKDYLQHNLYNLCILPKDENVSKSKKRLVEITDPWLKTQITKYTMIEEKDFTKFSDLTNLEDLKKLRSVDIKNSYTIKRDFILNN